MVKFILIKNKKAQAWSLDLVIASIIFVMSIVILYIYAINYSSQTKANLDEFFYEGNLGSNLILSNEDYGILSDDKINQTKLNYFDSLSDSNKKSLLGITNNFYFTFEGMRINGNPVSYIGIINSSQTSDLIQITRISIYENKPIKFNFYIWK